MAVYLYWWSAGVLKCPGRADIPFGSAALFGGNFGGNF